jgi:hypothetical protein
MNIYLSAIGWVDEKPVGNRLRWHYPVDNPGDQNAYVGLPESLIIERAPLPRAAALELPSVSSPYPSSWWDQHGDISLSWLTLPNEYIFNSPVQAVAFIYDGPSAHIVIEDAVSGEALFDRMVGGGEIVHAEGLAISLIRVLGVSGQLKGLLSLDLFKNRDLKFQKIAEIAVNGSYDVDLSVVAPRYPAGPTMTDDEWAELCETAQQARASSPSTATAGLPTTWQAFSLLLGLRWEYAVLGGFAYVDGPHDDLCRLDLRFDDDLKEPGSPWMAYRLIAPKGRRGRSNIAICPPGSVPSLAKPSAPWFTGAEVRLREKLNAVPVLDSVPASLRDFRPLPMMLDLYEANTTMRWTQGTARSIGVEVEEEISASAITGASLRRSRFMSRTRRADIAALQGSLARKIDVAFPDVTLRARVRAMDGWDRHSVYSSWSAETPLTLVHAPAPPGLDIAFYDNGVMRLERTVAVPGVPDWQPDDLVRRTHGRVNVYRRIAQPRSETITVGFPMPVGTGRYRATIQGTASLSDFIGGIFSAGAFSETIVAAGADTVDFKVPDNGDALELFSAGNGRLMQDPSSPALFAEVANFPAENLPQVLEFADARPENQFIQFDQYTTRLAYFGRLGPVGNLVTSIREPVVPVTPPPFSVEVLGIDFYHRVMIALRFTDPPGAGQFTIWWARGRIADADFVSRGSVGAYVAQQPTNGMVLFDVLPFDLAKNRPTTVTIGVQRVNEGPAQSALTTQTFDLPPPA